jgi:hypothetical protein
MTFAFPQPRFGKLVRETTVFPLFFGNGVGLWMNEGHAGPLEERALSKYASNGELLEANRRSLAALALLWPQAEECQTAPLPGDLKIEPRTTRSLTRVQAQTYSH